MKLLLTILLFVAAPVKYQLTPEMFGAIANDNLDDSRAFQLMADSAVKVNAKCWLDYGRYIFDNSVYFAKFRNGKFENFSVAIVGQGEFWDPELTIIDYRKKSGSAFAIQNSKGSRIEGIHFTGRYKVPAANIYTTPFDQYNDTSITDTRNDPYCAIKVDGELYNVNNPARSGSTGTIIRNCSFRDWVGAINYSPGGYTQNNELNLIELCRGRNLKYFLSGAQAQEKTNVIRHCATWDNIHTAFVFGPYGAGQSGQYRIYDFSMAGKNGNLISRYSQSFYSVIMDNVLVETLGSIGTWNTNPKVNNDALINSTINLAYPQEGGFAPVLKGNGILISNTVIKYNGQDVPVLMGGNVIFRDARFYKNPIQGARYLPNDSGYNKGYRLNQIKSQECIIDKGSTLITADYPVGDLVVFMTNTDRLFLGMGQVTQSIKGFCTISYIPASIKSGKYITGIYEEVKSQ